MGLSRPMPSVATWLECPKKCRYIAGGSLFAMLAGFVNFYERCEYSLDRMEPNGSKTAVMDPAVMRRSVVDQSTDMSTSRPPSPPPPATLDPAYGNVTSANPSGRRGFRGLAARRRSRTKVWLYLLGRWLVTVIFMVVAYAVLIGYEEYEVLSKQQKRQFSALIIGSLIALVLITSSQLTHVVGDLRWWILSCRPRSRAKVCIYDTFP